MAINNVLASVAVKDLKAAVPWYTKVLGHEADSTPMPEVAEWKFKDGGWTGPKRPMVQEHRARRQSPKSAEL